MSSELSTHLQCISGPAENTPEATNLQKQAGFSYRQVLGELVYTYVLSRPDIGYAVTLLSRFSAAPALEHYQALKGICKYLRATCDWGIIYWHDKPVSGLPDISLDMPTVDATLPPFPKSALLDLVGFVDAAHATDLKTRRSVTGYVFTLAGGAVAYKSKLQPTVSTSSTEAEFVAVISAAKVAKYLCSVLNQLSIHQDSPTILYEDNEAAIEMINQNKPTPRSHHIDIEHFAIQEWHQEKSITMKYISTLINIDPSFLTCSPLHGPLWCLSSLSLLLRSRLFPFPGPLSLSVPLHVFL
jgi:hypothetical protein